MKYLKQSFDFADDSISYTVFGETDPLYRVDSSGYLTEKGEEIGKFTLGQQQWHLYIKGAHYMSGPPNGLHKLPEFELKALTKLVNEVQDVAQEETK
jgi:hypothetical protein